MTELFTASTSVGFSLDSNLSEATVTFENETASTTIDTEALRIFGLVIGIFVIIVGSIGNFLTIAVIKTNKKLHKPFYIFIGNLSVIDFLTATLMLPFNVAAYYQRAWPFGNADITCTLMAAWYYNSGYTSIVCLIVITVNRYIGVVWPEKYNDLFTRPRVIFTIVISWLFAPIFLIPTFFFGSRHGFGWGPQITLCVFLTSDYTLHQLNYMQFTRALFQILPVVVMIVLYSLIFQTSRQSNQTIKRFSKENKKESSKRPSLKKQIFSISSAKVRILSGSISYNFNKTLNFTQLEKKGLRTKEICRCDYTAKNDGSHSKNQIKTSSLKQAESFKHSVKKTNPFSNTAKKQRLRHKKESEIQAISGGISLAEKNLMDSNGHSTPASKVSTTATLSSLQKRKEKNEVSSRIQAKRQKIDRRLLRVSAVICFFFMVLFLPSVIINFTSFRDWRIYPRINMGASVITWLNSCVNPIVYCFINANMRKQYKYDRKLKLLAKIAKKKKA